MIGTDAKVGEEGSSFSSLSLKRWIVFNCVITITNLIRVISGIFLMVWPTISKKKTVNRRTNWWTLPYIKSGCLHVEKVNKLNIPEILPIFTSFQFWWQAWVNLVFNRATNYNNNMPKHLLAAILAMIAEVGTTDTYFLRSAPQSQHKSFMTVPCSHSVASSINKTGALRIQLNVVN